MPNDNGYHPGEIAVQERSGERAIAERRAGMIGDHLVEGARAFLGRQGVAAVGAADGDGALWASVWTGDAGFLSADDEGEHLHVHSALDRTLDVDPVRPIVLDGAPLGMLVIDLATRQRLRINGTVTRVDATGLEIGVRETFGNCPKYIQRRHWADVLPGAAVDPVADGLALDDERRDFIARIDTAFVASIHPVRGVDVSHCGGPPGFILAGIRWHVTDAGLPGEQHVPDARQLRGRSAGGAGPHRFRAGPSALAHRKRRHRVRRGRSASPDRRHWSILVVHRRAMDGVSVAADDAVDAHRP